MTSPRNATTTKTGRWYDWRGERFWSVTTIIGSGVPKQALLPWGIKSVAEGSVKQREIVAAMLAKCETPQSCEQGDFCPACDQTVRFLKSLPYAHRDRAADLGTFVHNAAEAYVLGKPFPTWPPLVAARMGEFVRFLSDYAPVYEATELSVFNRTEKYAGTLDAIVVMGGRRLLLDVKTGKAVYAESALQCSAYARAEFAGLPDGSEEPMRPVDGAVILHLPERGGYDLIEVRIDDEVFNSFLYAREVFRWVEETQKTVLLGPPVDLALAASVAS